MEVSMKRTGFHCWWIHFTWWVDHALQVAFCCGVGRGWTTGWHEWRCWSCRWFLPVCLLMLVVVVALTWALTFVAVIVCVCIAWFAMYRSSLSVVFLGLPDLGLSATHPVAWKHCWRQQMTKWETASCLATSQMPTPSCCVARPGFFHGRQGSISADWDRVGNYEEVQHQHQPYLSHQKPLWQGH